MLRLMLLMPAAEQFRDASICSRASGVTICHFCFVHDFLHADAID